MWWNGCTTTRRSVRCLFSKHPVFGLIVPTRLELPLFGKSGTKNFYDSYATPYAPQSSVFVTAFGSGFSGRVRVIPALSRPEESPAQRRVRELGRRQLEDAKHPSKVFLVLFVHNRRCQRVQCKRSLQIAERRGGRRSQKEQSPQTAARLA